jgi:hypothetical protein
MAAISAFWTGIGAILAHGLASPQGWHGGGTVH